MQTPNVYPSPNLEIISASNLVNPDFTPTFEYIGSIILPNMKIVLDAVSITNLDDKAKLYYSNLLKEANAPIINMINNNNHCIAYFDVDGFLRVVMTPAAELDNNEKRDLKNAGAVTVSGLVPFGKLGKGMIAYQNSLSSFRKSGVLKKSA